MCSAVRDLNRLELAGESVRACLEQLAIAAPQVVAQILDDSWGKRYAARIDTWRMPASAAKKDEFALAYGRDGRALLKAVYAAAASDPDLAFLARLQQVEVLRVVLLQNYITVEDEQGREVIKRREAEVEGLPPGRSRITSPDEGCCPPSTTWTRATPRRSCWCPHSPATASRWSPRCWPTPHRRPGQAPGTTAPRSPSTSMPGRPPARKATPAATGTPSPSAAPAR